MARDYFAELGHDPENPAFEAFEGGVVPRPTEDFFAQIGYELPEQAPAEPEESTAKHLDFSDPNARWEPGHTERVGEVLGEATKEMGVQTIWAQQGLSTFLKRMKGRIPGYDENKAVEGFVDVLTRFMPLFTIGDRPEEVDNALMMLAESEYLKRDPSVAPNEGYFEDFLAVGPQIGGAILANFAAPVAGPAAFIGMQIMGSTYKDLLDSNVPSDKAFLYAVSNGIIQGALESIPFAAAGKFFKPKMDILKKIKGLMLTAGSEWITEWWQAYPDSFINIFAKNPDKTLFERAEMFVDELGETTLQGMYEGLAVMPWSLLTAPFGGMAASNRKKAEDNGTEGLEDFGLDENGLPIDLPDESLYTPQRPDAMIPNWREDGEPGLTRAPTRASSSVTARHIEMMSEKQQEDYYNKSFDEEFAERRENYQAISEDRENRKKEAQLSADRYARTKHSMAYLSGDIEEVTMKEPSKREGGLEVEQGKRIDPYDYVNKIETMNQLKRQRIQKGLDLVPNQDLYSGEENDISQAEYDRRAKHLGNLDGLYGVDKNSTPPDLRGAIALMTEQVGQAEAKSTAFIDPDTQNVDMQAGEAVAAPSTYPDWFKTPFTISYLDKGKEKGSIVEKNENFKYGLKRTDYMGIIAKLEEGKLVTPRESAIADHIFGMAQAVKDADPELSQSEDISQLEEDGYDIIGGDRNIGSLDLGDQVVLEQPDGRWDGYTVVSEDDGAGNMVLDSLSDRMYAAPSDIAKVVAHKRNKYWETMFSQGGDAAVQNAPTTLPGITGIKPLKAAKKDASVAAQEEDFEENFPELAEFFDNPEGISTDKMDRRKSQEPVGLDRRKTERRNDWMTRGDINEMDPADQVEAIQGLRKMAMVDVLTGVHTRGEWNRHVENLGQDIPHLFIDLDGFKWINDWTTAGVLPDGRKVKGGHVLGDQVLGLFGKLMRETAKLTGFDNRVYLYRYGGDEFSVLPVERDSVTEAEMRKFEQAMKEVAKRFVVDMITTKEGKHVQIDGLPYTSRTGGTINAPIKAVETAKEEQPARYQLSAEGKVEGKEPPTLTDASVGKRGIDQKRPGVPEAKRLVAPEGYSEKRAIEGRPAATDVKVIEAPAKKPSAKVAIAPQVAHVGASAPMVTPAAPKKKAPGAKFIAENISIIEGDEKAMVETMILDPLTGEVNMIEQSAPEAFNDIENATDVLYKFRECIKNI